MLFTINADSIFLASKQLKLAGSAELVGVKATFGQLSPDQ
jgi:hypothetical protein